MTLAVSQQSPVELPADPPIKVSPVREWTPRPLPVDIAIDKMAKNLKKAITEHKAEPNDPSVLESYEKLKYACVIRQASPLTYSYEVAEHQKRNPSPAGLKRKMEDFYFYKEIAEGILLGIFDGHGGHEVADFSCQAIQNNFSANLIASNGNVYQAFETLFYETNVAVCKNNTWDTIGSTGVVSFIDVKTNLIYTATLGDSEATIYRKTPTSYQSIPLSCTRNWSSRKDAQRAAIALNKPEIVKMWPTTDKPRSLRYPCPAFGVLVSRSFGDQCWKPTAAPSAISCKPKITVCNLEPGDIVNVASDGFINFVSEQETIEHLTPPVVSYKKAQKLVRFALEEKASTDDVTVMLVYATKGPEKSSV